MKSISILVTFLLGILSGCLVASTNSETQVIIITAGLACFAVAVATYRTGVHHGYHEGHNAGAEAMHAEMLPIVHQAKHDGHSRGHLYGQTEMAKIYAHWFTPHPRTPEATLSTK